MTLSRRTPVVLLVIALACAAAAVLLGWIGASLQSEANTFGASIDLDPESGQQMSEEQYRYISSLYNKGDVVLDLITPVLITGFAAAFAALSLLGRRWETLRRTRLQRAACQIEPASA